VDKFFTFFVIAWIAQGIGQHFSLMNQPLEYFLLRAQHCNAAQVAGFQSLLMIPWTIKVVFGVASDAFPLFGKRWQWYVSLTFLIASIGVLLVAWQGASWLLPGMILNSIGMAACTTLLYGLVVFKCSLTNRHKKMFALQACIYYLSSTLAVFLAGFLCSSQAPAQALQSASLLCATALLGASLASMLLIEEPRQTKPLDGRILRRAIFRSLTSKELVAVAIFIALWSFSPSFGTPLYFHLTNKLQFSQLLIGQLGALNACGMLAGALLIHQWLSRFSSKNQAQTIVFLGTASTLLYLLLGSPLSAALLEFFRGMINMIATLVLIGLATDVTPKGAESIIMGLLMALYNLMSLASVSIGGYLYANVLQEHFSWLILMSAAFTAFCGICLKWLPERRMEDHVQPIPSDDGNFTKVSECSTREETASSRR